VPLARRQDVLWMPQIDDARARDAGGGVLIEGIRQPAEGVARDDRVVVEQQQTLGARCQRRARPGIEPAGELPVVVEQQEPHAGARPDARPQARPLRRRGRVVDHDHLGGRTILREQRFDAPVGGRPALPGHDDGGDASAHAGASGAELR
jgi:hypothetical protein